MSSSAAPAPPAPPSALRLILTLGLISLISGFLIVLAVEATKAPIARNRREALEQAVFKALPGAASRQSFRLEGPDLVVAREGETADLYAGYAADGTLVGVALEAVARGYGGEIRMLYGVDPAREAIIGFTVLLSNETPGLGDKIAKDPAFLANFQNLSVALDAGESALAQPIVLVKPGAKTQPWQMDGISGATISSSAVARGLLESATRWLPRLAPHREQMARGEARP